MYKSFFVTIISLCFAAFAQAQTSQLPATLVQGNYNYLTLSRVDDIASTTTITEAQKVSLAEFFKQEESSISQGITSGIKPDVMEQLKAQLSAQFQSILTTQQLTEYSLKRSTSYLAKKDQTKSSLQLQP